MSADVVVQAPKNLQSYNRYSYVLNNPIRLKDPTGYRWSSSNFEYFDPSEDEIKQLGLAVEKAGNSVSNYGQSMMRASPSIYGLGGGMLVSGIGGQMSDSGMAMQIDGSLLDGVNVAFNPLYKVERGFFEAYSGYGMQAVNLGDQLSNFERALSGFEASITLAGTIAVTAGNVSTFGRAGRSIMSLDNADVKVKFQAGISQTNPSGEKSFFRGSRPGETADFTPKPYEFKVDAEGFVKPTHGVSVFDNADSVSSKGFTPHQVDSSTVPDTLSIVQRGRDPAHHEIVPKSKGLLTPSKFEEELKKIQIRL